MESRKALFKANRRVLSPQNHIEINRERHRDARLKRREELFQSNRIITPKVTNSPPLSNNAKENQYPALSQNSDNKMTIRQANYLQRFLKWKTVDKQQSSKRRDCKDVHDKSPASLKGIEEQRKRRSIYVVDDQTKKTIFNDIKQNELLNPKMLRAEPLSSHCPVEKFILSSADSHSTVNIHSDNIAVKPLSFTSKPVLFTSNKLVSLSASAGYLPPVVIDSKLAENKVSNLKTDKPIGKCKTQLNHFTKRHSSLTENKTNYIDQTTKSIVASTSKTSNFKNNLKLKSLTTFESTKSSINTNILKATISGNYVSKVRAKKERSLETNSLYSQLSTQMKPKHQFIAKIKQKKTIRISDKNRSLLQAVSDLQTTNTVKPMTIKNHLLKAQATSTKCKSKNAGENMVNCGNIPEIDRGSLSQTSCKDEITLPQTPTVSVQSKKEINNVLNSAAIEGDKEKHLESMVKEDSITSGSVGRTLESVEYFRIQLENEVKRLQSLCDQWQLYSIQNLDQLQENGGKELIDTAIGQTKLLTTKKLMQFKDLIDRCEECASRSACNPSDGSEHTKPVFVEDLEGWWDMLRLQSENIDKRFNNLLRLKSNNWVEADVVALPKCKPKVGPKFKRKPTAHASSDLKNFLRKAFADKQKPKQMVHSIEENSNEKLTPMRQSQRIIVVRDRKSYSPAKTVLRMSNSKDYRPSIGGNALLKTAIKGAVEENSRQQHTPNPVNPTSILKTPGIKNRGTRGVVFSAKKKVRRFQFTFDEGNLSGDESAINTEKLEDCEEDVSPVNSSHQTKMSGDNIDGNISRTYLLRNRLVKLRSSSEFM